MYFLCEKRSCHDVARAAVIAENDQRCSKKES